MVNAPSPLTALKLAIKIVGTQDALAVICGVTQQAVCKWVRINGRLPAEHVLVVEKATGISRHDLRPDIYPRDEMTDRGAAQRFNGIDLRAHNRADRYALGERMANGG